MLDISSSETQDLQKSAELEHSSDTSDTANQNSNSDGSRFFMASDGAAQKIRSPSTQTHG